MGYIGRKLRQRRLLYSGSNVGLIVPIDHGLTVGPISGLQNMRDISRWIGDDNISAVIAHKGMLERLVTQNLLHSSTGVILHLNGMPSMSKEADTKQMVTHVDAALRLGADAVSVQVNFTANNYGHNLSLLGAVTDATHAAGLPLLTMLYDKVETTSSIEKIDRMHKLIRLVTEFGADSIKIGFPESMDLLGELISSHRDSIQIFFAGGEKMDEKRLQDWTLAAMQRGANGLCIGRNVFQHPEPSSILRALSEHIRQEHVRQVAPQPITMAA